MPSEFTGQCQSRHPQRIHRQCERPAGHEADLQDEDPFQHRNIRAYGEFLEWWDRVAVATTAASRLTIAALNDLWSGDQDKGCCSFCCGPCYALSVLVADGSLDDIVRPAVDGHHWWVDGQVDRDFLWRAWRRTDCHDDSVDDGLPAKQVAPMPPSE